MGYTLAGSTREIECNEGEMLCLPSLWAEWRTRGRWTASYGAANYVGINSVKFGELAAEHGGHLKRIAIRYIYL